MRLQQNEEMNLTVARFEAGLQDGVSLDLSLAENERLVAYYTYLRSYSMVMEVLDMAIDHHPYAIHYKLKKASTLLQLHQPKDALILIDEAAVLAPRDFDVLVLSIQVFIRLNQLDLAAQLLEELPEPFDAKQQADAYLVHALWHETQLEFERMYYFLRAALDLCPEHLAVLEKIAIAVESTKRYEDSIRLHRAIIDRFPYNHQAWYNLGLALVCNTDYLEALEAFEYAFIIDPYFKDAYKEYIGWAFNTRQYHKVLHCYEDVGQNFDLSSDPTYLIKIGQAYQAVEDFETAEYLYKEIIKWHGYEDEAYAQMAECRFIQCDYPGALHYYSKAIQLDDKREDYYAARAEVYLRMDRLAQAESDFISATRIAPQDGVYWVQYCSFLMQIGRAEEALYILEEEVSFEDPEMLYCRIACLFLLGKRKEARYRLLEAIGDHYDAHSILFDIIPDLELDNDITAIIAGHHYP
ncbi:MAG: hypothetical protein Sapg2KO_45020 [Saprospiraceae bacterium]